MQEIIEKSRLELHEFIERYGTRDMRTVKKSQELDVLLNEYGRYLSGEGYYYSNFSNSKYC